MADIPVSYKDPYWSQLASVAEQKTGIPTGLLSAIVTKGERSNANQVSEAKAQTVFQIIPSTRNAILKKYGIDPYLSPENAAEGAALLLKESLDRNKGDIPSAVAEYHGGTDKKNWGPKTKAYVARVTAGQESEKLDKLSEGFSTWLKQNPAETKPATKEAAKTDPLNEGFSQWLDSQATPQPDQIPGNKPLSTEPTQEPSLIDQAVGAGEAGLNTLTGLTTGALGMAGGSIAGIGKSVMEGTYGTPQGVATAEEMASQGADALTYQPRTELGQQRAAQVGEGISNLIPLAPFGAEVAAIGKGAAPITQAIKDVARPAVVGAVDAIRNPIETIRGNNPTQGTARSGGSAGTDAATIRRTVAADLPVPIEDLTTGQATRDFTQQQFEKETAKQPQLGAPLRERFENQNEKVKQNLDAFVDGTGAEIMDIGEAGKAVVKPLIDEIKKEKARLRVEYKDAEKSGELASPVNATNVANWLNENVSAEGSIPLIADVRKELVRLGGATAVKDAGLTGLDIPLNKMEKLRQFVNANADQGDGRSLAVAGQLKSIIDKETENAGGDVYKRYRRLRTQFADKFENRAIIADLVGTKRGMKDRLVDYEKVFHHTILDGSLEDVRFARRVLQTSSGEAGTQAWKELQGQTAAYLREQALKNVTRDSRGNEVISVAGLDRAVNKLDKDGKLNYIFGKKGAQKIRDVNDLAKVIYTAPPGSVNMSGTAAILLAALDKGIAGLPVAMAFALKQFVKNIKDRKIKAKVQAALDGKPLEKK